MMKWFDKSKLHTVAELRAEYKKLLVKHHPDNGGNVADMQKINSEYDALYALLKEKESADDTHTNCEENERFKAVLSEIIGYNITIEIIGSWIWVFDSYAYKDRLKELGFKWAARKRAWIWHAEPYHRHHKKEIPLSHIKARYGCETVRNKSYQYSLD